MANIRQGVPPGWTWREGRPRWIPSPTLRKAGWKGRDLRDGRGEWLGRGPSIAAAEALAQAVAAWKAGEPVPVDLREAAPAGASSARAPGGSALDPFSIGGLIDAYLASNELATRKNGTPRPPKTLSDYRTKLKRLVDTLAGYADRARADAEPEAYAQSVARVRALSIFTLEPAEGAQGMDDPLYDAYWALARSSGKHMAFGVMSCASAWLTWCRRRRSRTIKNWVRDIERETPAGRIRPWTLTELGAMVAAADRLAARAKTAAERLCLLATADAFILAVDLAWSQVDVLELTWSRVASVRGRRVALGARQKTGRVGGTPFLSMGARRLAIIEARQQALPAQPLKVIYLPRRRKHAQLGPLADGDYLRDHFEAIRAEAAGKLASCAEITFADTRDTGFTLGRQAGLTDAGIASRTRQSLTNIKSLSDRNYGEIGPEIADPAADQLDVYLEAELKKHKVAV